MGWNNYAQRRKGFQKATTTTTNCLGTGQTRVWTSWKMKWISFFFFFFFSRGCVGTRQSRSFHVIRRAQSPRIDDYYPSSCREWTTISSCRTRIVCAHAKRRFFKASEILSLSAVKATRSADWDCYYKSSLGLSLVCASDYYPVRMSTIQPLYGFLVSLQSIVEKASAG